MTRSRATALAVLLLCAFSVNVDTTIVNVALPTLSTRARCFDPRPAVDRGRLHARLRCARARGRRRSATASGASGCCSSGSPSIPAGNGAAALVHTSEALIACRAVMGLGAAIIFPATLSTIVHLFRERGERAKAIGLWGATTGIAVALGPIVGGALLEASGWQAAFWLKVPIARAALRLALAFVPESGDPRRPRVDRVGLALSSLGVLALVFTIIEAPDLRAGSRRAPSLGFAAAVAAARRLRRARSCAPTGPLLDVRLFRNPRFCAASAAITFSFFALFGFIFLITQYFQVLRGYEPLETGLRLLPVALSTGTAAVLGNDARRADRQQGRRRDGARPGGSDVRLDLERRQRHLATSRSPAR